MICVPELKENKKVTESLFTEIITENFPNLRRDLDIQVNETHRPPNIINLKSSSARGILINKIRCEREDTTLIPYNIKNHKRLLWKWLNIENMDEMDKFLGICYQEEYIMKKQKIWIYSYFSMAFESMSKNCHMQKSPGPGGFTGELYQIFNEEFIAIPLKWFQEIKEEGILLNLFYNTSITLISEPDRDITRKIQTNTHDEHKPKTINKILTN